MRDSEYEFIRQLVYQHSRISLGPDKRQLVSARLGKRLRATRTETVGDYCQLLQGPRARDELGHLIDAISTNHTFFFREIAHFDFLRTQAIPEFQARAKAERWSRLEVWSAACSSGEEPYSIAMVLAEQCGSWPWHIEATDISRRILNKASLGIYSEEPISRLPPATVRAHFQKGIGEQEGNYRVKAALRDRVRFHYLNLLEGQPPFHQAFQVIFCRNVMIYFDRPTQEELVQRLARRLVPGGYLFVGHSESLTHIDHGLEGVRPAVYRKPAAS